MSFQKSSMYDGSQYNIQQKVREKTHLRFAPMSTYSWWASSKKVPAHLAHRNQYLANEISMETGRGQEKTSGYFVGWKASLTFGKLAVAGMIKTANPRRNIFILLIMGCPCMPSTAPNCTQHAQPFWNRYICWINSIGRKPQYLLDDTNYFKDSAGNHSSTVTLVRTNDSTKREKGKHRGRENLHSQKRSKATHDRQDEEAVWSGEISEPQSPTFLEWRHLLCHVPYLQPSKNPTKSRVPIFRDFQFEICSQNHLPKSCVLTSFQQFHQEIINLTHDVKTT